MDVKRIIVIACLLMLASSSIQASFQEKSLNHGKTLYVGGSGPENYTSIQDAIDDAMPGDTIFVYDDSSPYHENIIVDKSLAIIGENMEVTIDGTNAGNVIEIDCRDVSIKNFTIKNGSRKWYYAAGIFINSSHAEISNCIIFSNDEGIYAGRGNNVIQNCSIYSNNGSGISLPSSNNLIKNCRIFGNDNGIYAPVYTSNNNILDCEICKNKIGIWASSNSSIKNCLICNNTDGGIIILMVENGTIANNTFIHNGIMIDGLKYRHFRHKIKNNSVNGEPLIYLFNESDRRIEEGGEIILAYCKNIVIKDVSISNTDSAIELMKCRNISIFNCMLHHNMEGIYMIESEDLRITKNSIQSNGVGMDIAFINSTTISRNTFSDNNIALRIFLYNSHFNFITRNNFIHNGKDVDFCIFQPLAHPSFLNIFLGNYWNRWHVMPKAIPGFLLISRGKFGIFIPWIKFDFMPSKIKNS